MLESDMIYYMRSQRDQGYVTYKPHNLTYLALEPPLESSPSYALGKPDRMHVDNDATTLLTYSTSSMSLFR